MTAQPGQVFACPWSNAFRSCGRRIVAVGGEIAFTCPADPRGQTHPVTQMRPVEDCASTALTLPRTRGTLANSQR